MGCTNSKPRAVEQPDTSQKPNPLTSQQLKARSDCPLDARHLDIGDIKTRYAWVSQRGYYPDSPDKDNQDAYCIIPVFGNPDDRQAYFGIYDGHGKDGHLCARFARENLGKTLLDKLKKSPPNGINATSIKQILAASHLTVNEAMHASKRLDDTISGTTSISVFIRERRMYISNVGDSRAVVVSKTDDDRLVAKPLSSDQTPYRKDERDRCKKLGARVLTMAQIDGNEPIHENWGDLTKGECIDEGADPPRVWSPKGNYLGTAFTRSLGDMLAEEECGVIAEPEILDREIQSNDKYLIIASDGVFEFLTNQMVADMCTRYPDPLDACKAIVQASYDMWLQYDCRTDDITVIAIYLDDIPARRGSFTHSSSFYNEAGEKISNVRLPSESKITVSKQESAARLVQKVEDLGLELESRPVRRAISREKRKFMITLKSDEEESEEQTASIEEHLEDIVVPKAEGEESVILAAMRNNFLFQHLNTTQRQTVVNVMTPVEVKKGQWIIKQGDAGDKFYIVDNGKFEVRVKMGGPAATAPPTLGTDEEAHKKALEDYAGNVVHVYESGIDQHPGFGELSLMYGKPRAASVIALTDGKLWALDRKIFRHLVLRPKDYQRNHILKILKKVELFSCLNITQLQRLIDLLHERQYAAGEKIITQGEFGDTFYLIVSGQCDCSINNAEDPSKPPMVVMKLSDYAYFGERALLESKPRAANVIATSDMKVMYIEKHAFEEVLGPLANILEEDRVRREALAAEALSRPKTIQDITLQGQILLDGMGPILIGHFASLEILKLTKASSQQASKPTNKTVKQTSNVTIRSFNLNEVTKSSLVDSLIRYVDAVKFIRETSTVINIPAEHGRSRSMSKSTRKLSLGEWEISHFLVPHCVTIMKDSNAIHLVFDSCIVSDLGSFIRNHQETLLKELTHALPSSPGTDEALAEQRRHIPYMIPYSIANIILALEFLHKHEIMYRAIQPEAIYLNAQGQLVLMDYRYCKIGITHDQYVTGNTGSNRSSRSNSQATPPTTPMTSSTTGNNNKAFTLCGIADYLAPEQIAQTGHSYSVDFWAMGVLLYELTVGSHPFASSTEVATYSKISSFGTKAFPSLKFPEGFPSNIKSLINQLLVPTPEARIGTGSHGFFQVKNHAFFEDVNCTIELVREEYRKGLESTLSSPIAVPKGPSHSISNHSTMSTQSTSTPNTMGGGGIACTPSTAEGEGEGSGKVVLGIPSTVTEESVKVQTKEEEEGVPVDESVVLEGMKWWEALENGQLISPFLFYTQQEEKVIVTEGVEESITAVFTHTFDTASPATAAPTSTTSNSNTEQFHVWLEQLHM